MTGRGVSAVTASTAHREWALRPPDERYATIDALYEAACARRDRTEARTIACCGSLRPSCTRPRS